jgi:biopolymer transport protein ExbD
MKIKRKKMHAGVPAVAMADIAFNLVLFFIMMAKTQDDSHLQWEPASTPVVQRAEISKVSVVVDKQQKLYLNGQQIGVSQLKAGVEHELQGLPAGKRAVLLKIHKEATAQVFEPIVEAVSEAGGEIMHILEERRTKTAG